MLQKIVGDFFPGAYNVYQRVDYEKDGLGYIFELHSTSSSSRCPECCVESIRGHSYQFRSVRDLPILGEGVTLLMYQRRYFCDNLECGTKIFTESNELVRQNSKFTNRCREYMLKLSTHMNCESASKILSYQGIRVSGDTLLNILREAGASITSKPVKIIGVDDWAYRKGHEYGTLICDMETHEIIDVLEGRDKETLEKWLQGHPEIEIVSRDRSASYASAVTTVLPNAVQIADRFHITQNLLDALTETMKGFMPEKLEFSVDRESVSSEVEIEHTEPALDIIESQAPGQAEKKTKPR
jgi:transposase